MNSTHQTYLNLVANYVGMTNSISIILLNGLVILSMIVGRKINSYTNFLLFLILFFSMVYGFLLLPKFVIQIWFFSLKLLKNHIESFLITVFCYSPVFLVFLSYHRFRLIKYPVNENENISTKSIIQIFSILILIFILELIAYFFYRAILNTFIKVVFFLLPAFLSFMFLALTILGINSKRKNVQKYCKVSNKTNIQVRKLNRESKAVLGVLVMAANIFVFLVPLSFMELYYLFKVDYNVRLSDDWISLCYSMGFLYQISDPIILLIFNNNLRKNFLSMLKLSKSQEERSSNHKFSTVIASTV